MGHGKQKGETVRKVKGTGMSISEASPVGMDLFRYLNGKAGGASRKDSERSVKELNQTRRDTPLPQRQVTAHIFEVSAVEGAERSRMGDIAMAWTNEHRNRGRFVMQGSDFKLTVHPDKVATVAAELRALEERFRNGRAGVIADIQDTGRTEDVWFGDLDTSERDDEDEQVLDDYDNLEEGDRDRALRKTHLNEYASPEVGEAFGIQAVAKRGEQSPFPYHWAGVVAKAGGDTTTLENYAGREANEVYFTMYGTKTQVEVQQDSVSRSEDQGTEEDKKSTTFHKQWEREFQQGQPGLHTITHATKMTGKK